LSSVARDARDQARHLADRHRDRKSDSGPARQESAGTPARGTTAAPRRRRFKRRWVVVPVLVTVLIVLIVLVGLGLLVAAALGLI
jgi:Flp pilus assembly protein TadB